MAAAGCAGSPVARWAGLTAGVLDSALAYVKPRDVISAGLVCRLWRPVSALTWESDLPSDVPSAPGKKSSPGEQTTRGERIWRQLRKSCLAPACPISPHKEFWWRELDAAYRGPANEGGWGTLRVSQLVSSPGGTRLKGASLMAVDGKCSILLTNDGWHKSVQVCDNAYREQLYEMRGESQPLCVTADAGEFAVGYRGGSVVLFNTESGKKGRTFDGAATDDALPVKLCLTATYLAVGLQRGDVDVHSRETGSIVKRLVKPRDFGRIQDLLIDGTNILAAYKDGRIAIWDLLLEQTAPSELIGAPHTDVRASSERYHSSGYHCVGLHRRSIAWCCWGVINRKLTNWLSVMHRATGRMHHVPLERTSICSHQLVMLQDQILLNSGGNVWSYELGRLERAPELLFQKGDIVDIGASSRGVTIRHFTSFDHCAVYHCRFDATTRAAWLSLAGEWEELTDSALARLIRDRIGLMPAAQRIQVAAWLKAILAPGETDPATAAEALAIRLYLITTERSIVQGRFFGALSRLWGCSIPQARVAFDALRRSPLSAAARPDEVRNFGLDPAAFRAAFLYVENRERVDLAEQVLAAPPTDAWWMRFHDLSPGAKRDVYDQLAALMSLPAGTSPADCFAGRWSVVATNAQRAAALRPIEPPLTSASRVEAADAAPTDAAARLSTSEGSGGAR